MIMPFFCAICDKPIALSVTRKHNLVHDKCMSKYLEDFKISSQEDYKKSTNINKK